MKELSQAILNSKKSKIRKLFDMLLKSGSDAISFGIGQPDFTSPDYMNDAIIKALREHKTQYAPARGIPQLREIIAYKFKNENNMSWVKPENTIVTNGGSQALQLAYAVLTNPGDEMILSSPAFLSYYHLADYYGIKCVEVPAKNNYSPDIEGIKNAITPKTKFILINSPSNPTGYAFSKEEMDAIVALVLEHDLYLVSDEVYEKFYFDGMTHISPASYEGMKDRTITLNALSKTFGATGLRLGYIAASEEIIINMEKYIQYTTAGVNHPVQYGAIEGLKHVDRMNIPEIIEEYDRKRQFCVRRLKEMKFIVDMPKGAFYIMPKLNPEWGMDGDEFSNALVQEQKVACVPGSGFGSYSNDSLRISYATSDEKLEEGFNRIEKFLRNRNFL
ncbi:Aromatic-amino-acid aminotransferase 2 [Candidatus Lokiarchaeum ossiferum]|uniref:Aromatic-amino-acid aminotransferase 2 n=1 Tax=Candidatus Lokiarchaeum ossiferum TaxID=2951803 RepID=A0ABY6HUD6_9ARCH|nr:Aromatic-amino-acid aminotransferase 2 [Candidatus Lokiarchaeum sp. B-35]